MATVSGKLNTAWQGALAGGGDPATSPLYVFGPFLQLLVATGAVSVVFGASIWLAIGTVIAVSFVYRLVMRWIVDGSGGSGLCEEEFGPWAVKVNASITVIEYTLTFLVSMAALVTFVADRFPLLNVTLAGISLRLVLAMALIALTCYLVNRGPRVASAAFGPATAAVLLLLWMMIGFTVFKRGLHLPNIQLEAFSSDYIHITLGGYARILALMTGIEIFANLVAAYEGNPAERSHKAFGSLLIIMFTTGLTMLVVGPAIAALSDPHRTDVSVFTQTMDQLLPPTLSYAGSLIGIAVLLSACAASAQGIQNIALGLRYRHYLPPLLGQRNRHGVASLPVWIMGLACAVCFFLFGTHEETYLALYAAGVFVLLSLTCFAVVKRLSTHLKEERSASHLILLAATVIAATLTSLATFVIFQERFKDGAWIYLILVPVLYLSLGFFRHRLGAPPLIERRLGHLHGLQMLPNRLASANFLGQRRVRRILVPLDTKPSSDIVLPQTRILAHRFEAAVYFLHVTQDEQEPSPDIRSYFNFVKDEFRLSGLEAHCIFASGKVEDVIESKAAALDTELIIMSIKDSKVILSLSASRITKKLIHKTTPPVLLVRATESWRSLRTQFLRVLIALDGSTTAEQVLAFVHDLLQAGETEIFFLSVPEGGGVGPELTAKLEAYLDKIMHGFRPGFPKLHKFLGSGDLAPGHEIVAVATAQSCDLIMMVSHGSGGIERQKYVKIGSVAEYLLMHAPCPVFLVSAESLESTEGQDMRPG